MRSMPIGPKIREHRKGLGITQVALAQRLGISPSYLNLIEGNRRNIGGGLLKRLADELGVPLDRLDGTAEGRLVDDLAEISLDPLLAPLQLAPAAAAELTTRQPAWARALVLVHRAYVDRHAAVAALSDRLGQDPMLADAMHSLLTNVSAIRSAAEILESEPALGDDERQRFVAIVAGDSRRVSDVAQALAGLFAGSPEGPRPLTPADELDDFIAARDNHFANLEAAASALRDAAGLASANACEQDLVEHLRRVHGVTARETPWPGGQQAGPMPRSSYFDPATRVVELLAAAAEPTRRFELARVCAELEGGEVITRELEEAAALTSAASRQRARHGLAAYLAAATVMPYEAFRDAAAASRHDLDHLGRRFGASFEQVAQRLTTLRRPGAEGLRFGFLRADPSGRVSKRLALPRLPLPRHAACPLWAVFSALQTPGATFRQLAAFPSGDRYLLLARAVDKPAAHGGPRRLASIMLMCDALHADRLLDADGLDVSPAAPHAPVGPGCRICVRRNCAWRQEEPIVDLAPAERRRPPGSGARPAPRKANPP